MTLRLGAVLLIALSALLAMASSPGGALAVQGPKALTLPFEKPNIAVTGWVDHNLPGSACNNDMRRYDGQWWTDGSACLAKCTIQTGNCCDGHTGTDFGLPYDSNVVAAASGTITEATSDACRGTYVRIWHGSLGYATVYAHLKSGSILVNVGQLVSGGQRIAKSDTTGSSDCIEGAHLHFAVYDAQTGGHPIDPFGWAGGGSDPWQYDQGYLWQHNPPGYAEYTPAVASWFSSRADQFVRGQNNALYQRTWNGSSWTGWSQPIGGSCLRSGPTASTWATNRLDVFVHGCDNGIWHNWWTGGSWPGEPLGGCTTSAPAAASWGSNRIALFVRGCDNVLYKNLYGVLQPGWSGWIGVSGTCMRSGPSAVSWGTDRVDLVYRDCNDAIRWHWSSNGGQSLSSQSLGGCTMVGPAIASWSSGRLDVFARGCSPEGSGDQLYRIRTTGRGVAGQAGADA